MKIRALPKFEGIRDIERSKKEGKNIFPKAGDVWEVTEERAKYLKSHGVIEIVEEVKEAKIEIINKDNVIEKLEKAQEEILKDETIETIPVVRKDGFKVGKVEKPKSIKKKKNK